MQTIYHNRILWDLAASTALEKNVQYFTALPSAAGACGVDYAVEAAPPSLTYDLTASGVSAADADLLQSCADDLNAVFSLVTNGGRTVTGRLLTFSRQEVAGTSFYNVSCRLRSTAWETELNNNFVIHSFTS